MRSAGVVNLNLSLMIAATVLNKVGIIAGNLRHVGWNAYLASAASTCGTRGILPIWHMGQGCCVLVLVFPSRFCLCCTLLWYCSRSITANSNMLESLINAIQKDLEAIPPSFPVRTQINHFNHLKEAKGAIQSALKQECCMRKCWAG